MKKLVVVAFLLGFSCVGDTGENVQRKQRIIWLVTNIASYIDSSPDPKYWAELDSFGAEAIPVVSELLYSSPRQSAVITVFAQLKGNDKLIVVELRKFVLAEMDKTDYNVSGIMRALYCLARKGNDEDIRLLSSLETHTNRFVKATAKSARIKLAQRLEQEKADKHSIASQPVYTPVLDGTGIVKTAQAIVIKERAVPNVPPNQVKTPRKIFPYLMLVGGALLVMCGSVLLVMRKRKSGK